MASEAVDTALFEAIGRDDVAAVEHALACGADPNAVDPRWPAPFLFRALSTAAARGNPEIVRSLLAHGADVDGRDAGGGTALIWACNGGFVECARLLLEAGADVHLRNDDGYTAYGRTPRNQRELIELLRTYGGTRDPAT
ncbi:ankyrin repeat domain-containing protein [Actinomadura sp. NPDC047616]|uniref:ankyrin repeat domain-containing protein n=1 Tax=Actinomadura sp. NPDC047616 TaxID=3155914 RepID=UPI0034078344